MELFQEAAAKTKIYQGYDGDKRNINQTKKGNEIKKNIIIMMSSILLSLSNGCATYFERGLAGGAHSTPIYPATTMSFQIVTSTPVAIITAPMSSGTYVGLSMWPMWIVDTPASIIIDTLYLPKDIYDWAHWIENKKRNDAKKAKKVQEEMRKSKEILSNQKLRRRGNDEQF